MLRVDHDHWGQTLADLRRLALSATHPRSRERFLALHDIAQGDCATEVAERTERRPHTVMDWLHAYNERGPEALMYRRTGGRPPLSQDRGYPRRRNPRRTAASGKPTASRG